MDRDGLEKELRKRATEQAGKAVQMWFESKHMFESPDGDASSRQTAIELNGRAIDEFRSAINIFNFFHGLEH